MQHTLNKAAKDGFVRAFTTFLIVKELKKKGTDLFSPVRDDLLGPPRKGKNESVPFFF